VNVHKAKLSLITIMNVALGCLLNISILNIFIPASSISLFFLDKRPLLFLVYFGVIAFVIIDVIFMIKNCDKADFVMKNLLIFSITIPIATGFILRLSQISCFELYLNLKSQLQ
jgi:hypothetical protein